MKGVHTGTTAVSPHVAAVAATLVEDYPADIQAVTGLTLVGTPTSEPAVLDLVAVTESAVLVGIATGPEARLGPRAAGRLVVQLQQVAALRQPLPVYAFWLGQAPPPGSDDDSPALPDAERVLRYVLRASAQSEPPGADTAAQVTALLRQADGRPAASAATPPLRRALRVLGELPDLLDAGLNPIKFARRSGPVLPADINRRLEAAMFDRQNLLEDVNYGKIVPNDYLVELNEANYQRHYRPIEAQVREQWRQRLLDALNTANGRQGRKTYRFGGGVRVRLRPVPDLAENEVRITARIQPEGAAEAAGRASGRPCLEAVSGGQRWPLREGVTTIGRNAANDIHLDTPEIKERRMVSSFHAYIRCQNGRCRLFDGSVEGKASLNGTFVNGRPTPPDGQELQDGDQVVLAAFDPQRPRPDAPGVAGFYFRAACDDFRF